MAPVPPILAFLFPRVDKEETVVGDLSRSSLELDSRTTTSSAVDNLYKSLALHSRDAAPLSPVAVHDLGTSTMNIHRRATTNGYVKGAGSRPAKEFSGPGYLVLFALLGTGMVVASIWFFFWAKNGGFHFQQDDWDDYKSTVLRRKGPDGKTLSNATKSTRLGGGSVVHGQNYTRAKSEARTVVGRDEKGRKGILAKRGWGKTHSVFSGDDYMTESWGTETVSDGMTEVREIHTTANYTDNNHSKRYRDRDVHHYKREKAARVGGLNRVADGSHFDYTNTDRSDTYTEASAEPLVSKKKERKPSEYNAHKERSTREHARTAHEDAERNAKIEAAKMERRWKKEAEEAAAALARENAKPPPPKTSAAPAAKPGVQKQRRNSRSASPKKRDFSYQNGPASEVLSTAYTASTTSNSNSNSARTASYYDAYRPKAQTDYSSDAGKTRGSRQSSPRKGRARDGGYRRGADSDLD